MGLFFIGALFGALSAARYAAEARARRKEIESRMRAERMERERQLEEERKSAREANRKQNEGMEKHYKRRLNRYLFSPSGGIGIGEDDGTSELGIAR